MRILVVDDEQDLCEILKFNLETEGYEVTTVNSAEEALQLDISGYQLILLDVMLVDMSGFQMARRLKEAPVTRQIPIIFITALDGEDDTVKGLNIGADDYISKPLSMKEVKARVRTVLRRVGASHHTWQDRTEPCAPDSVRYEGIIMNLDSKKALLDGQELNLTRLEFELLSLFLHNQGKVFGRNDLLERCWPQDTYVLNRTVDVSITRLRKKIGRYGQHIKTRVGYGYCFEK